MAAKVFISYRRDDSAGYAGRLMDRLKTELGPQLLFMDVEAIPLGTNFEKVLHEEVAKCGVLLAVVGPTWSNVRDDSGNRRLDDPNDFVRIEIAAALQRNIPVIPILLDGARMPKAGQLPNELKDLASRNGLDVRHASFHEDVERLIRSLKGQMQQSDSVKIANTGPSGPSIHAAAQDRTGVWSFFRDKRNQQVLGWLGGGLVVVATGAWAAFVYLFPLEKTRSSPTVQAECGGVAISGNVTGATITGGATTGSDCTGKPK